MITDCLFDINRTTLAANPCLALRRPESSRSPTAQFLQPGGLPNELSSYFAEWYKSTERAGPARPSTNEGLGFLFTLEDPTPCVTTSQGYYCRSQLPETGMNAGTCLSGSVKKVLSRWKMKTPPPSPRPTRTGFRLLARHFSKLRAVPSGAP